MVTSVASTMFFDRGAGVVEQAAEKPPLGCSSRADLAMLSAAASNRSKKDTSRGRIRSFMVSASQ
jgi:hypothetical protein